MASGATSRRDAEKGLVSKCRLRAEESCPFSDFCYTKKSEPYGFYPELRAIDKGDYQWTYSSTGGYVTVVESGLLVSLILLSQDGDEVPYGIFPRGIVNGLVELQTEIQDIQMTYALKAVTDSRVCVIPRAAAKRLMQQHPQLYKETLSMAMTNIASAAAAMCTVLSRKRVYDKVLMLLRIIDDMIARDESLEFSLRLTHEDISTLVSADRVSVTRALAKMKENGLVNLGYRHIIHNTRNDDNAAAYPFFMPLS